MEPENPLLDDYLLGLAGAAEPRVCFVPTASGDAEGYLERFYGAFADKPCEAAHLSLFGRSVDDLAGFLRTQHIIYVGGGNTVNMLAVWRAHGLDAALREAWQAGVILAGVSAGAVCWFDAGVTDSFGPTLAPMRGLGFLPGSMVPHYDSEAARRPRFHELCASGAIPGGIAADDGVALRFEGTDLAEIVSSRPGAAAYRVEVFRGSTVETRLPARVLG